MNEFTTDGLNENVPSDSTQDSKWKGYGQKSLSPLVDLLHRYRGDVGPYLNAIGKGLQAAVDTFQQNLPDQEQDKVERVVSGWFQETNTWFGGIRDNLGNKSPQDLLSFLEEQARLRPAVMFSSSYAVGLIIGRLGKHLLKSNSEELKASVADLKSSMSDLTSTTSDNNSIH